MKTTQELIDFLEIEKNAQNGAHKLQTAHMLMLSAQRLRKLDKPDCVWTEHVAVATFAPACTNSIQYYLTPKQAKFCPNCGGSVKEAT